MLPALVARAVGATFPEPLQGSRRGLCEQGAAVSAYWQTGALWDCGGLRELTTLCAAIERCDGVGGEIVLAGYVYDGQPTPFAPAPKGCG